MESVFASKMIGGNPEKKRASTDFYPTPDDVTEALILHMQIPKGTKIWEPACGDGRMVRALERFGYQVVGTDINRGEDFLLIDKPPDGTECIITNPPFSLAEEFIRHAYEIGLPFAFLLKSQFWHAKKRYKLFLDCQPSENLPLTWRPDFLFGAGSGAPLMDVVWNVWYPDARQSPPIRKMKNTYFAPLERPVHIKEDENG